MRLFSNSFEKGPGRSQSLVQGNLHHYVPVFSFKTLKLLREILLTIDFSVEPSRRKIYMGGYCITAKKETKLGRAGTFPSLVALIAKQVFIAWRREGTALRELRHQSSGAPLHRQEGCWVGGGGGISYASRYLTLHWEAFLLPRILCSLSFHSGFLLAIEFS